MCHVQGQTESIVGALAGLDLAGKADEVAGGVEVPPPFPLAVKRKGDLKNLLLALSVWSYQVVWGSEITQLC